MSYYTADTGRIDSRTYCLEVTPQSDIYFPVLGKFDQVASLKAASFIAVTSR